MADVAELKIDTTGPYRVGTSMTVLTKVWFFRTNDLITVTEWEPESHIRVTHRGLVGGDGIFRIERLDDNRTRLIWRERLRFPWYFGGVITAWVTAPILRRIWCKNLERFNLYFI